ncbi:Hypothetical protein PFR_JS23-PH_64 [Propionibacterium freudenreichii]|uniref:Uncharacterized protein n=1 Tax=Propionibacterium freudenreichii TaxID=1744 RepID=A0A509MNN7_9ACTN|nr:Hypothetical protein PFR_JS23-PH_64 [Propionibacterium freudenreichii]SUY93622.1 Hypothetical protein PFR_JS23-PH_64 [Propionibacterium freudenreichii]
MCSRAPQPLRKSTVSLPSWWHSTASSNGLRWIYISQRLARTSLRSWVIWLPMRLWLSAIPLMAHARWVNASASCFVLGSPGPFATFCSRLMANWACISGFMILLLRLARALPCPMTPA